MFCLVDQNVMRRPELAELARDAAGPHFVLLDTAFVEMCKHERWEPTMRGSLAALASVPHRVHGGLSYGLAMRKELESSTPIGRDDLLSSDHTRLARRIMAALNAGGHALKELRSEVDAMRTALIAEQIDQIEEKARVGDMIASFRKDAGRPLVAAVQKSKGDQAVILGLVQDVAEKLLMDMLVKRHATAVEVAAEFVKSQPLLLRHNVLRIRQVVTWIVNGGFDCVSPDRILNDRFDQEYVAVGSYFDEVLTRDRRAREADQDLRFLLADGSSEAARAAYRKLACGVKAGSEET